MENWRPPIDESTIQFIVDRLVDDREIHLEHAHEAEGVDELEKEKALVRAEECARIIKQLGKLVRKKSDPPLANSSVPPPFFTILPPKG